MSGFNRSIPAASTTRDIEDIEAALRGERRKGNSHQEIKVHYDPRFSKAIGWMGIIFAGIITYAICWSASATLDLEKQMVGVQRDIADLVARPEGVSRYEYNRDAARWDHDIDDLKRRER